METQDSNKSSPSKRRPPSRLTTFAYHVIILLACLWLISTVLITGLTAYVTYNDSAEHIAGLVERVSEFLNIDVAGAIGAIASCVIARYGLREATANLKSKDYSNTETEKEENNWKRREEV